ncbi:MAG: NfeD family protein [Theionarchaea archaeon]|nr:MAG: hypothetical protein AYK19_07910 [Theionarchaea archaeon DG-70-1]MBU7027615.1 NfeD family protein [Theionarchaea archaeon]
MYWKRIGAILVVLADEMAFTILWFVVIPFFGYHLPLAIYIGVMMVLVVKDIIVIKLIWNVVVKPPEIGKEALIGKTGTASTDMDPYGIIKIGNELWKAETLHFIKKGEKVKVTDMNGLFLEVESVYTDED